MPKPPTYDAPPGTRCPSCGCFCRVVPLRNEFDYAGTHCTYGQPGIHYPAGWGSPVSDCCEADIDLD